MSAAACCVIVHLLCFVAFDVVKSLLCKVKILLILYIWKFSFSFYYGTTKSRVYSKMGEYCKSVYICEDYFFV